MKNSARSAVFVLCCLLTSFYTMKAQPQNSDMFSPSSRLKFGNHLFADKDYLRAIDEYKAFLKTSTDDTVMFRFAESYLRIGRYSEAADNFKTLFFNSPISEEAKLEYFKAGFFENDYRSFRDITQNPVYSSGKYSKEINRLAYITYLFDNEALPDTSEFRKAFPDSVQPAMMKFYIQKKFPAFKSASKASWLSALLPGLGKIYTGEISNGITNFIATSLLVFLTVDNFRAKHNFRGAVFGTLTALSYAGGIYGAAASANLYNAGVSFNFERELKIYLVNRNYFLPEYDFLNKKN